MDDVRNSTRSRSAQREQILWTIEGCRGQKIQLTAQRQIGKQRRCHPCRLTDGAAHRGNGIAQQGVVAIETGDRRFGIFEHAPLQVSEPPGHFVVFVPFVGLGGGAPVHPQGRRRRRAPPDRRSPRPVESTRSSRSSARQHSPAPRDRVRACSAANGPEREYGPAGRLRKVNRPSSFEIANAEVDPSAETTAPARGLPRSSLTTPFNSDGLMGAAELDAFSCGARAICGRATTCARAGVATAPTHTMTPIHDQDRIRIIAMPFSRPCGRSITAGNHPGGLTPVERVKFTLCVN